MKIPEFSFSQIVKVVSGLGVIVAAVMAIYTFFAPQTYVEARVEELRSEDALLAMRLDRKILQDRYEAKKKERRAIEIQFQTNDPSKMPSPYDKIYQELLEEEKDLRERLKKLDSYLDQKKYHLG